MSQRPGGINMKMGIPYEQMLKGHVYNCCLILNVRKKYVVKKKNVSVYWGL